MAFKLVQTCKFEWLKKHYKNQLFCIKTHIKNKKKLYLLVFAVICLYLSLFARICLLWSFLTFILTICLYLTVFFAMTVD